MKNNQVEFDFDVPAELYEKLCHIAQEKNWSVEELILFLVEQNINEHSWLFDPPPTQ